MPNYRLKPLTAEVANLTVRLALGAAGELDRSRAWKAVPPRRMWCWSQLPCCRPGAVNPRPALQAQESRGRGGRDVVLDRALAECRSLSKSRVAGEVNRCTIGRGHRIDRRCHQDLPRTPASFPPNAGDL